VTRESSGGFGFGRDFDSVLEFDTLDDFLATGFDLAVFAKFRRRHHQLENHEASGGCDNAPFMRTVRCLTVANTLSMDRRS